MDNVILACNVYSYGRYLQRALEQAGIRYAEVSISEPEDVEGAQIAFISVHVAERQMERVAESDTYVSRIVGGWKASQ